MSEMEMGAFSRRRFIAAAGSGIVAANILGGLGEAAFAQGTNDPTQKPIPLPQLDAPTEKKKPGAPLPTPPDKRIGYAIVGLGTLALEQVLPAFGSCKKSKPVALVSGERDKGLQVARQYGIAERSVYDYKNYDSLRDNPDVDVIYIILPNSMHAEYTVRGAQAGKHILCEKPMANSVKECQQMIDAVNKAGKKLMIAYRMQYEPYNRMAIQMVRSRELGNVRQIIATNGQNQGDPNQWRQKKALAGGGSLPDVGIYCLNATRYLTGEEPIEIMASEYSPPNDPRFREVEDSVLFTLRFPSGVVASCTSGYSQHEKRRLDVMGERAWLQMDPAFAYRGLNMKVGRAMEKMELIEERKLDEKDQFATEMDHMSECVMENKTPHTPGEEGMQDMRLIAAIYEAARTGRPVKMPNLNGSGLDVFRGSSPSQNS